MKKILLSLCLLAGAGSLLSRWASEPVRVARSLPATVAPALESPPPIASDASAVKATAAERHGISAEAWASMRAQAEAAQREFRKGADEALHSVSPRGGERLRLTAQGGAEISMNGPRKQPESRPATDHVQKLATVSPADTRPDVTLALRAAEWGREGATAGVTAAGAVVTEPHRAERVLVSAQGRLVEWWRSEERGFQVGWTVQEPPAGEGPLALDLALDCPWPGTVAGNGRRVDFVDPAGSDWQLTCTDLLAFDATGRHLPAEMTVDGGRARVRVDDAGARYPVVIDPWIYGSLRTTFRGPNAFTGMRFGARLAACGDVLAAGANAGSGSSIFGGELHIFSGNDYRRTVPKTFRTNLALPLHEPKTSGDVVAVTAANAAETAVHVAVCERNAGGPEAWGTVAELPLPDGALYGQIALDGIFLAAAQSGATRDGLANAGLVTIHRRDAGGPSAWGAVATLDAGDLRQAQGIFGMDVVLWGRTLLVAAVSGSTFSYLVFERSDDAGTQWTRTTAFAVAPFTGAEIPHSRLVGDTLAVAMPGVSAQPVRIHQRHAGGRNNWGLTRSLPAPVSDGSFGYSLALSGSTLAVGSPTEDVDHDGSIATPPLDAAGRVRIYSRDQGGADNWGLVETLSPTGSLAEADAHYGEGLAFGREGFLFLGYPKSDLTLPAVVDAGSVGAYQLQSGTWERTSLPAQSQNATDWGAAVDVSGTTVLVGAPRFDGPAGVDAGWAFLFRDGVLVKSILPPNQQAGERFGAAVALDGDRAVVGSPLRSGTLNSILYADLGAVTIFERNQGGADNWGAVKSFSQPTIGASGSPQFGTSVALDGDVLAVGAPEETALSLPGAAVKGRAKIFERNTGGAENWGQVRSFQGADNGTDERFGTSVALQGDTVLVGAPYEDVDGVFRSGAVYVHRRNQGGADNWGRVVRLTQPEVKGDSLFGQAVALDGDDAVVGAPREDRGLSPNVGAVYFFARGRTELDAWVLTRRWQSDEHGDDALGGSAVAVSHGLALVSTPFATATSGAVRVVSRDLGGADAWGEMTTLGGQESFGTSVALDGRVAAIGEPLADVSDGSLQTDRGRAEMLTLEGGEFVPVTTREAPAATASFGQSVALHREWLVVGAPEETVGGDAAAGAAYVFHRDRPTTLAWGLIQRLTDVQDNVANSRFGTALAINDHWLMVGVPGQHRIQTYFLRNDASTPTQFTWVDSLSLTAGGQPNAIGTSLALEADTLLAGAPLQDVSGQADAGAAYVFRRNQGGADAWVLADAITAADPGAGDAFGSSVALADGTAAIGAPLDNNAEGTDAGAVYLCARNQGGTDAWGQIAKLVPGSLGAGDEFGRAVALRDGLLLAGAPRADTAGTDAGAAHLFARNQGGANAWGFVKTLVAPDGTAQSRFGTAVAVQAHHAVVGAPFADPRGSTNAGTVHVFGRDWLSAASWSHMQALAPTLLADGAQFGHAVAFDGVFLAITSPGEAPAGRAHVYDFAARRLYDEWASAHGLEGAWSRPEADADGDGQPNLVEMILGSHPLDGSVTGRIDLLRQGNALVLTAWKNGFCAAPVLLSAEVSSDLATWLDVPPQNFLSEDGSQLRIQLPVTPAPTGFARFRAQLP